MILEKFKQLIKQHDLLPSALENETILIIDACTFYSSVNYLELITNRLTVYKVKTNNNYRVMLNSTNVLELAKIYTNYCDSLCISFKVLKHECYDYALNSMFGLQKEVVNTLAKFLEINDPKFVDILSMYKRKLNMVRFSEFYRSRIRLNVHYCLSVGYDDINDNVCGNFEFILHGCTFFGRLTHDSWLVDMLNDVDAVNQRNHWIMILPYREGANTLDIMFVAVTYREIARLFYEILLYAFSKLIKDIHNRKFKIIVVYDHWTPYCYVTYRFPTNQQQHLDLLDLYDKLKYMDSS